jgi:hypothetical protein
MKNSILYVLLMVIASFQVARVTLADEVVLTSGERFTSSKVWEENGKLLFDLQGLIVSVSLADVATIIRSSDTSTPSSEPMMPPPKNQTEVLPQPPDQSPAEKPVPPVMPKKSSGQDPSAHKPKARGIGLDGLTWQMKPSEISGIARLESDPSNGDIDQYWWPAGNLTLGDVILDGLIFGFWQNRLYSIMFWVDGHPGYTRLQQAVFDRYGPGNKNENGLERYVWRDETTDRMLEFDPKLNTGLFWMRCRDLDRQFKLLNSSGKE